MKNLLSRKWIWIVWICFLLRGLFYCSVLPLWDGFDEWAHFAVVQIVSSTGRLVIDRNALVSREINSSLELAPLPRGMTHIPPYAVTKERYWDLPSAEQVRREVTLRSLPVDWAREPALNGMPAYEASQPPLYYWLVAVVLRMTDRTPLLTRVWIVRNVSFFIGSVAIPIGFLFARRLFGSRSIAVFLAALITLLPELAIDLARVSNESLAITMYTTLLLTVSRWLEQPQAYSRSVAVGIALGLGSLTKAYFLTALPALACVYLLAIWCEPRNFKSCIKQGLTAFTIAFALAGWWYFRNYMQTGTVSGLDEALMLKNTGFATKIASIFQVNWLRATATVLLSHLWYGGWSLLTLPHWVYFSAFGLVLLPVWGFLKSANTFLKPERFYVLSFYGFFWLGQAYQIVMLFMSKSSSTSMGGWYLYSVIWAEAVLGMLGLIAAIPLHHRKVVLTFSIIAVAALDLYGLHAIALPYYAHVPLTWPFDISRLLMNTPSFMSASWRLTEWILFVAATGLIAAIGLKASVACD